MKTWVKLILVGSALLVAAVLLGTCLSGRCPLLRRPPATVATPANPPAPPAEVTPKPEPARVTPQTAQAPSTSRAPLDEKQFIEISSTILMHVAQVQDRPDAKELIPPLMAAVLRKAGVTEEEFSAAAQEIYSDPARSRRVGDAILDRVEERSTPQMRMRVASLAEAMRALQQAKANPPQEPLPHPESGKTPGVP